MWTALGQWNKVVDKTESQTSGGTTIAVEGYAYVLILKAFTYRGTPSLRPRLIYVRNRI